MYLGSVGYWGFVYIFCLYDADVHNFHMPYKMELSFLRLLRLFSLVILVLWEQPFLIGKCVRLPCPLPPSSTLFGSAYLFFLSCDGKTKNNFWLSEPTSDRARIASKCKEKKKRQHETKERRGRLRRQSTDCTERRVLLPPPCEEIETERRRRKTMHEMSESGQAGSLHSLRRSSVRFHTD
jgi:hypothetical protein